MLAHIITYIKKHTLIHQHDTILVGLSGGPDSVCLLHILVHLRDTYKLHLIAAHLDHEWRPNSFEDMLFCKHLAETWNVEFITAKASHIEVGKKYGGSQEEWGRLLRRCFFESLAKRYKANSIALGHHQDDQQETFFIRLIRGASITGLASMKPKAGLYIRPLLSISKASILAYLKEHNLAYRKDYTNEEESYLRNRIRLKVIPSLRASDARFDTNFAKTINHLQETDTFLDNLIAHLFNAISEQEDGVLWIDKERLLQTDPFLYPRLLIYWLCKAQVPFTPTNPFFDEIIRFLQRPGSGTHHIHPTWSLIKKKKKVCITIP